MDHNPGDQSHLTHLEHSKVQVKSNQLSTEQIVLTAATVTEIAGTSSVSSDQELSPSAALPTMSASTVHGDIVVKVEDESIGGQSVHICKRVKKEEYDEEYLVVECDCEECRVMMEIREEEEEIVVKEEIDDEEVKIPMKRLRMDRVPENYPTGPPSHSTVPSTNSIPVKIEYLDEHVTTSSTNPQTSSAERTTEAVALTSPSTVHSNITVKVEDSSICGQSVQLCKKEEFYDDEVQVHCYCGCEDNVKSEVKMEIEEVEVKDKEHDRLGKREETEPISDEEDGMMHEDRTDDAEEQQKDELTGGDEESGGIVGSLQNDQVNDGDQANVIQDQTNAQLQVDIDADQIEVQRDQEHLSDIDYELEMLRNVFVKPVESGQFGGQFLCDYPQCGKRFDEQKLLAHLKLHTKPFVCDAVGCLRRFTARSPLTAHQKSSHTANLLQCDLPGCVKRFKNVGTLNLHKRDHTDEKVFICEWADCEKVTHSQSHYRLHLLTHSDDGIEERQLVCDWAECARKFTTQLNLSIHRKLHTGESPFDAHPRPSQQVPTELNFVKQIEPDQLGYRFECGYENCGKRMKCKANLIVHIRSHTEEKPFKCPVDGCEREFAQNGHLANHARFHSEDRPFVCRSYGCTKAFKCMSKLNQHQKAMHNINISIFNV